MKYICETKLCDFPFWSQAKTNASRLSESELDEMEQVILESDTCETPTDTEINDLMWFEFDWLCESIGLDPNEVMNRD